MPRMTHFKRILKRDFFKRIAFVKMFLSTEDVLTAAVRNRGRLPISVEDSVENE